MNDILKEYVNAVAAGSILPGQSAALMGRIVHGKTLRDLASLTNDRDRKLVMVFGSDGLDKFVGRTGYEMLVEIGYTQRYLEGIIRDGEQFKLVVFSAVAEAKLATWDNVIDMAAEHYPAASTAFRSALSALKGTPYPVLESQAGYRFGNVVQKQDPRFMTCQRLLAGGRTPADVRAFLYHSLHLRELYAGDGYTYTRNGSRGVAEYIAPNRSLDELGSYAIFDLELIIPES